MYTVFFVIAIIALMVVLAMQLIKLHMNIIKIKKTKELNQTQIMEDSEWEFIKGLY